MKSRQSTYRYVSGLRIPIAKEKGPFRQRVMETTFRSARRADYAGAGAFAGIAILLVAASFSRHGISAWMWLGIFALALAGLATLRGCRVDIGPTTIRIRSYLSPTKTIQRGGIGSIQRRRDGIGFVDAKGHRLAWCAGLWDADTLNSLRSVVLVADDVH